MSRIGNLTRLIYTYIRTRQCLIQYTGDLHIPDIHILYFIRQCVVQYTRDLHIPVHILLDIAWYSTLCCTSLIRLKFFYIAVYVCFFPAQLTMSRIGNLTRLIYTYIRTRQCLIQYTGDLHIPDIHILYFIRQCVVQYTRDLHIPEHTYFIRHCLVQYTMLHIPD